VGVLVDPARVPRWVEALVEALVSTGRADVVLVLDRPRRRQGSVLRRAAGGAYRLLDRALLARGAGELEPTHGLARRAAVAREDLARSELDVLFVAEPDAEVAGLTAREGVWGWRARDAGSALAVELVGFGRAGEKVLVAAYLARSPISRYRNEAHAAWKAGDLLLRQLAPSPTPTAAHPASGELQPLRTRPLGVARALLGRQIRWRLYRSEWLVAYRAGRGDLVLLVPPAGEFFADPFPIGRDGRRFIFFEHYLPRVGHGVVSYVELGADGAPSSPRVVLSREHHLSYPFLFAADGDVYMLPSARIGVELYRAEAFPDRWTLVRDLLPGVEANDPTLLARDGRLWLFVNLVRAGAEPNEELHLYSSDSLVGDWSPHPQNPVVSDVRSARPAGRIFEQDGRLLRPGQDCAEAYGRAVVLNRIDVISAAEYRETPVARIEPTWLEENVGTHTYNADGDLEAIDAYRLRLRMPFARRGGDVVRATPAQELVQMLRADGSGR